MGLAGVPIERYEWGRKRVIFMREIPVLIAFAIGVVMGATGLDMARPAVAPAEVHFAPGENLERVDVALIGDARATIDVAAYVLTDRGVIDALAEAAARGVRIRVWRDPGMAEKVGLADVAAQIEPDRPEFELREKSPGPLMHLKGYCVDGAVLRTGSANFSRSGLTKQDNDLVVLRSRAACARFEAKFEKAWAS